MILARLEWSVMRRAGVTVAQLVNWYLTRHWLVARDHTRSRSVNRVEKTLQKLIYRNVAALFNSNFWHLEWILTHFSWKDNNSSSSKKIFARHLRLIEIDYNLCEKIKTAHKKCLLFIVRHVVNLRSYTSSVWRSDEILIWRPKPWEGVLKVWM